MLVALASTARIAYVQAPGRVHAASRCGAESPANTGGFASALKGVPVGGWPKAEQSQTMPNLLQKVRGGIQQNRTKHGQTFPPPHTRLLSSLGSRASPFPWQPSLVMHFISRALLKKGSVEIGLVCQRSADSQLKKGIVRGDIDNPLAALEVKVKKHVEHLSKRSSG